MLQVAHRMPGRIRLKPTTSDFDLAGLKQALDQSAQGWKATYSGTKGSLVLSFEPNNEHDVLSKVLELGYTIEEPKQSGRRAPLRGKLRNLIVDGASRFDRELRRLSNEEVDLSTLVAVGCAALGIMQIARGKFLPSGMVLFLHGSRFLEKECQSE